MRPVSKSTNNRNYQPPSSPSFSSKTKPFIKRVFGNENPTLQECLDKWLEINEKFLTPSHKVSPDEIEARKIIMKKVEDIYKQAGVPLVQDLGAYCSYCESPITGLLEVEHILPKTEYPTFSTDWENFLLACNPCNRPKGANPSRITVKGWKGGQPLSESDYRDEIRRHYVWPDEDADSYRKLPADLWYKDPALGWQKISLYDAAYYGNKLVSVDIANRTAHADLYFPSTNIQHQNVEVLVKLSDSYGTGAGDEMIKLCALNDTGNKAGTYDRRVLNRTVAWFTILMALNTIIPAKLTQTLFDQMWPSVILVAKNTGFYSLWVRILGNYVDPNGMKLDARFVADTNKPFYFPNTETRYLP